MKRSFFISILLLSISLNGFLFYRLKENQNTQPAGKSNSSYKLVSPITPVIDSNIQNSSAILHYAGLKPQIETEIRKSNANQNIAIFLQDVKTGAWLGINEKEGFTPASLLKVPIAMAILKKVDREEIKLTDIIELAEEDLDEKSGTLYQKGVGGKLAVWEAIKTMIQTSDNTAKNALKRQLSEAELNAVFAHVGIPNPYQLQNGQMVSPRGYSRIFKALYFATFLSADLSEKLLDLSTDTQMESLISAGIPPEIQIAHKYGERPDGIADCGIVYHPKNPYYLCIMTREVELSFAKALIADLSSIIYKFTNLH